MSRHRHQIKTIQYIYNSMFVILSFYVLSCKSHEQIHTHNYCCAVICPSATQQATQQQKSQTVFAGSVSQIISIY